MDAPSESISRGTTACWTVATAWIPAGLLFSANADHFGWGFLPWIVWIYSLPPLAGIITLWTIFAIARGRTPKWAIGVWLVVSLLYIAVAAASLIIPDFPAGLFPEQQFQ